MPNRNSRRNSRGTRQQAHQTVQDDAEQAQQQQQRQLGQLDHLFRDLGVTANLDPTNSLPSRAPRQHNMIQGDGSTERTKTMVLRETLKPYAAVVGGSHITRLNSVQLTYTSVTPAACPDGAAPNNIPTSPKNGNGTPQRNETQSPHPNLTTSQATGTTSQINKVQFPNLNVSGTSQELSTQKPGQIVPATPLIQSRNNRGHVFDTSNIPASPQPLAIDRPCPIPRANHTTRNPSRTNFAHGSPRLGLGTRSPTLERVQQLPTALLRPTSPTLDQIRKLRRAENGIKNKASTQPFIDSAQATPLCGQNIRAERMETNSSTKSSKTALLNPSAASFSLTPRRQADSESMLHLPLENDVAEDGIVAVEQKVLIAGDEADEFEVIENVTVVGSGNNGAHRKWWNIYRR